MQIYSVIVTDSRFVNNNVFFQEDFKATSLKRAYQLAEDKLWNTLVDAGIGAGFIQDMIDDAEFDCVDVTSLM